MNRKKGTRVYLKLIHETTKEEKKRWGTLAADEGLWDYSDVFFDDFPNMIQPILCYFLWDDTEHIEPADFSAGWEP